MDKSGADSTSTWLGRTHFSRSICYRFNSGALSSPSLALLQDFASASIARRPKAGYIKLHDDQSHISQDDLSLHENSLSSSPHHTTASHEYIHGSLSGAAEPSQDGSTRISSFRRRSISVGSGLDSMTSAKADPDQQYCACEDHLEYGAEKIGEDGESDVARAASWSEYFVPQGNESAGEEGEDWMINLSDLFLGHRFASGAYSRLYLGKYKGEEVAVKVLRQPEDSEEISRKLEQQFRCEVSVLSRVHHRNIIKFIGACKKPPVCCILTEYLPSGSVRAYLHNHLPFSPSLDMVIAMALDIAQGMEYLHSQGVIHRDLKSENLLLADDLCVKITDFGVACFESEIASMTEEVGTYRWMAPEMIKSKHFSRKADVYSFGIVLWELLTGHIPFEELSPVQAAFAVVHKHARPPLPLACPSALGHLMHQCWSADPGKRPEFSKVVEVLENLKASTVLDRSMSIIQRRHRHNHSILRCFGCGLRKDAPGRSIQSFANTHL